MDDDTQPAYDLARPWNQGIRGTQSLPLVNDDAPILRVEAGPGTGKTTGLVRRVQRILHPDGLAVPGKDVLVVAFNRVIANDLDDAIGKLLQDSPHNGDPEIRTVHALCLSVIGGNLRILLDHECEAMIYDVLTTHPGIRKRLTRHSDAEQALRDHEAKHHDDPELWQAVFHWLTRHRAHLISQLPGLLLDSMKQGDYAGLQYQHVIVDEFQDLTPAEQQLFLRICKSDGQFVALGDPRQSIYAFRGNDREGLRKLDNMAAVVGKTVQDVSLPNCQRCPVAIVDTANRLMQLYPPPMQGGSGEAANLHAVTWKSPQAEAEGMAKAIHANIEQHPAERHLAMVTRQRFGYWLRDALLKLDPSLAVDLSFSESLLENWAVREAFLFMSLLIDPDPPTWRAWLGYKNSSTGDDYKAPERNADAYLRFFTACADEITESRILELAAKGSKPQGKGAATLWQRAKRYAALRAPIIYPPEDAETLVATLLSSDRWVAHGMKDGATAATDLALLTEKAIGLVREHVVEYSDAAPEGHLRHAIQQLRYQIATREPFVSPEGTRLQITTLWGAKGATAEHVYVLGLSDEAIPGEHRDSYPGTRDEYIEEQRRLLYVSLTRSRKTLVLSRATSVTMGQARQIGLSIKFNEQKKRRPTLHMSSFLPDIIALLPDAVPGERWPGCVMVS